MHYVYILESVAVPGHFYIGSTDNLRQRLRQHQADVDAHAAKYRPWKLKTYLAFEKKSTAVRFESYLKSGSGRAFCRPHFDWWLVAFSRKAPLPALSATPIKRNHQFCFTRRHMRSQWLTEISRSGRHRWLQVDEMPLVEWSPTS